MKTFLTGLFLLVCGMLLAGVIALTTAPSRGEPITLLSPPTPHPIIVEVDGAVTHPGLVFIPSDSRVQHALDAAGGPLPDADLTALNLASPIEDGEQILVPFQTTSVPVAIFAPTLSITPLNINTATVEELAQLPGIGPVTAQRIVEYRAQFGLFATIDDLTLVFGVGTATVEKIRPLIMVAP